MQYIYTECTLPSNGLIYKTKTVHLRPKTIFDIKTLLNNPVFMLKSEIDALNNCISPEDNIDVYDLVNADVVYLLYKLRSMSDDCLNLEIKGKQYTVKISDLEVKYLDEYNTEITLPESKIPVRLKLQTIGDIFGLSNARDEFMRKYPEYRGDALNTISILNSIDTFGTSVSSEHIRNGLEQLSWKDSLYLIQAIEDLNKLDFGIKEQVELDVEGEKVTIPLQITEQFFRPTI